MKEIPIEPFYNEVADQIGLHSNAQEAGITATKNKMMQYEMEEKDKNLAEAQLDVEETLTKIYHLLKQDALKINEDGVMAWVSLEDLKKRVLTDEGVDKIMQIMQSYINKETLLSNFDEATIKRRMLKFSLAFSALLFLKYELYFRSPSQEECYDILTKRVEDKIEKKRMSCRLMDKEFNEKEVKCKILEELKGREEYELGKIKQEQVKINLREFEMIFTQLEALIEATHNRAWKGEERGSLRRHFNISEVIGGSSAPQIKKRKWGMFG